MVLHPRPLVRRDARVPLVVSALLDEWSESHVLPAAAAVSRLEALHSVAGSEQQGEEAAVLHKLRVVIGVFSGEVHLHGETSWGDA